jgi:hypothetical protein
VKTPRTPTGLKGPGRRLWTESTELYTYNPSEKLILEKACRSADRLARLEKAEAELTNPVVHGARGAVYVHPLGEEIRRETVLLSRLLEQIRPPGEAEKVGATPNKTRAQRAAEARWSGSGRAS